MRDFITIVFELCVHVSTPAIRGATGCAANRVCRNEERRRAYFTTMTRYLLTLQNRLGSVMRRVYCPWASRSSV